MNQKIIAWESWNELEKDSSGIPAEDLIEEEEESHFMDGMPMADLSIGGPELLHTPFGHVPLNSKFKPSDRWDCWVAHTNFGITKHTLDKIGKIDGVDAIRPLSRYSFCIGVGKLFKSMDVKEKIKNEICH
jgi:hypothetical protein